MLAAIRPEAAADVAGGGCTLVEGCGSRAKANHRFGESTRIHRINDAGYGFAVSVRRVWHRADQIRDLRHISSGSRARSAGHSLGDGANVQGRARQLAQRAVTDAGLGAFKINGRARCLDRSELGEELPALTGEILPIEARDGRGKAFGAETQRVSQGDELRHQVARKH